MNNNDILKYGILSKLYTKVLNKDFVYARGEKTVELQNWSEVFTCEGDGYIDIEGIFVTSRDYINHELNWYLSQNPNSVEISKHAQIWSTASDNNGMANSNYGYLIWSPQNGYQFNNVIELLKKDKDSRRAIMYYTNPMMHYLGGNDHVCTLNVGYMIRDNKVHANVTMRSNDIRFGLIGADLSWQIHVLKLVAKELNLEAGNINWYAMSAHLYERHFDKLTQIFKKDR